MPEYKIKVTICLSDNRSASTRQFVLKGSSNPKEALFYSATKSLGCPVLPRLRHIWLECMADNYNWMLMDYYPYHQDPSTSPLKMVSSMACYHAWFWDNVPDELAASHWQESEVLPFTGSSNALSSLKNITVLYEELCREWQLPPLGNHLKAAVSDRDSLLHDLYSYPKTVIHCDLHDGNFIDVGKEQLGIVIDWSGACVSVPFFDLMRTVDFLRTYYGCDAETLYSVYQLGLKSHGRSLGEVGEIAMLISKARFIFEVIRLTAGMKLLARKQTYDAQLWQLRIPAWASLDELNLWVCGEIENLS